MTNSGYATHSKYLYQVTSSPPVLMISQQEVQITAVTDELRDNNADNNGDKRSAAGVRSGASESPAGAAVGDRDPCVLEQEAHF